MTECLARLPRPRKAEIVATTLRLADELGPDRLTTQAVADAVGLTQPGVFRHFPTKQALWLAVSDDPIRAVAVLVVATPCPLILAVPVALVAGLSRAAHFGVLIKGAKPLGAPPGNRRPRRRHAPRQRAYPGGRAAQSPARADRNAACRADPCRGGHGVLPEAVSPRAYGRWFEVVPCVRARFWNAGHLLGSASVEMEVADGERPLRLLFSADIGPDAKLLQPEPQGPVDIDHVVCEATYGDSDREATTDEGRRRALRDEVRAAIHPNGALLIPSFAMERAQELVADLTELMATSELPDVPIYVDSPLAAKATRVFARHARELEGGVAFRQALSSRHLHFTQTAEQSMALDRVHGFHIVIAASGVCEAGRIRHRLKTRRSS